MLVRVLVDGVYNGPQHNAVRAAAGAEIEVAGGWYAAELIAAGLVELLQPGPVEIPAPEVLAPKSPEPRGRKLTDLRRLADVKEGAA